MITMRLVTAGALLLCLGCSATPVVDAEAEAREIRELDRQWLAAFADKDIEQAMQFFASEATLMPSHSPMIVGRPAIQAWFESWLPDPAVATTFTPDVIEVAASGDLAYDRGTFEFTMETPDGRLRDSGKYLVVWTKIAGEWKALLDISNSDLAQPELLPTSSLEGQP